MYSLEDKGFEKGVRLANGTHSMFRYQKVVKFPDCKRRLVLSLVVVQWRRPHHLDSPMIRVWKWFRSSNSKCALTPLTDDVLERDLGRRKHG